MSRHNRPDDLDELFRRARQSEPDLGDAAFTAAVMRRVETAKAPAAGRKQNLAVWLAGLFGAVLAASVFPAGEIVQALIAQSTAISLAQVIMMTLVTGVLAFTAYWIVEADGI